MPISKKIISKKISSETNLSFHESYKLLNIFIDQIKKNSKLGSVKIHKFGTFFYKTTTERIGRNPKTKESYKIKSFRKLSFKPSSRLKDDINWYNLCILWTLLWKLNTLKI